MWGTTPVPPAYSGGTTTVSAVKSGTSSALSSPIFCVTPTALSSFLYLDTPASQRLISGAFKPDELPFLIKAVFSSEDQAEVVRSLSEDDAQTFIDVTDEVRSPPFRRRDLWPTDDAPRRLGAGDPQSFAGDPKEVSQSLIQNMQSQQTHSEITFDPPWL